MPLFRIAACTVAALATAGTFLAAQQVSGTRPPQAGPDTVRSAAAAGRTAPGVERLVGIGSLEDERIRLDQILGRASTAGYLIRSTSTLTHSPPEEPAGLRLAVVSPAFRSTANSKLHYSPNEGAMWSGRGRSWQVAAGVDASYGRLRLLLVPQATSSRRSTYQTVLQPDTRFHPLASPWPRGVGSIDLPQRFAGDFVDFDLGQSALTLDAGAVALGASTENQWWGPGIRNAIVMSNNAAGIPHVFLRTSSPARTRIGSFEAKWMLGTLSESAFFDADPENDLRSISALAATFTPALEPDLTLGVTRAVYAPVDRVSGVPGRAFDVFVRSGRTVMLDSSTAARGPDQLLSLFARWVFPEEGAEVYGEWAREEIPTSVRDLLAAPNHTQGYTLGLQWAGPARNDANVRLQTEVTYLEQSATFRQRRVPTYYVSPSVPQGYTHKGEVIGAAIGPGASSQWAAADYIAPRWQVGLFGTRIRWENDAYYTQAVDGRNSFAHDVSLLGGARGSYRLPWMEVGAELTFGTRYNYLFQNWSYSFEPTRATDVSNRTLRIFINTGPQPRSPSTPGSVAPPPVQPLPATGPDAVTATTPLP
jgi:hypothetical protein